MWSVQIIIIIAPPIMITIVRVVPVVMISMECTPVPSVHPAIVIRIVIIIVIVGCGIYI